MTYSKEDFQSWYLVIIGFFYAGQGFALGSLVLLLPLYILDELAIPTRSQAVTIAAIIIFPWYIKFVFGLITDNFPFRSLRRKPYLVLATLFSLVGWSTIGLATSVFPLFLLSGISLATGSALGDAVIDGLAVEITPLSHTGRLQGVNWGSRGMGLGLSGIVSANLVSAYSWDIMFLVAGIFGVTITLVTLVLPEVGYIPPEEDKPSWIISQLKMIFTKPRMKYRVAFFLSSGFALSVLLQLTLIMDTEFEYSFDLIGIGALSFAIGSFFGSIVNGIISDKYDRFSDFNGLSIAYGCTILSGTVFAVYRNFPIELLFFFFIGVFGGAYEAYQLKVIQEETAEHLESTIFAIYTGISNIGQIALGGVIVVFLADTLRFPILYSMQIVLIILAIASYSLYRLKFSSY